MGQSSAYEVRHKGRTYRAPDRKTLETWARELRISGEDLMRRAGSEDWQPVSDDEGLAELLSPESWWHVTIGDRSYTAPDFDTVVQWAREGRLTVGAEIEGPRTPPGGVLASGLPRLAPYLREMPEGPADDAPVIRIDGTEYHPEDTDTVRRWIGESRVPPEAEISLSGGDWEPIGECGLFEPELWPEGAWGQPPEDGEDEEPEKPEPPAGEPEEGEAEEEPEGPSGEAEPEDDETGEPVPGFAGEEEDDQTGPAEEAGEPYAIDTIQGRVEAADPQTVRRMVKRGRIRSFDRVVHPDLPEGECSVGEFLEMQGLAGSYLWVWILIVVLLAAAAVILFDPFGLGLLQGGA
jgi:hypothetical protein